MVFAFSIFLYLPAMTGGTIWDDDDLVSGAAFGGNNLLSAFTHPFLGHYFRPLTSASFVIDSWFAKGTPFYFHQTNMLLHAITAVLIAWLTLLVTKKQITGFLGGLFFATQPLQVGAAAWIGGRTDVLSTCFLAAFMGSIIRYHQTNSRWWLLGSNVLFLLAALSKEQAAAMLLAVPLSVFVFGSKEWKDVWKLCKPFGVTVIVYIILWCIDAPPPYGAHNSLIHTVTLALRTAAHYGLAFLTPTHSPLLTFTLENMRNPVWMLVGAALVAAFLFFLKLTWKSHRPLFWVSICGLLVYMPVSNFPTVPSFVVGPYRCAEAGTAVAVVFGAIAAYGLTPKRFPVAILAGANLVVGTLVTWWGVHIWTTPLDLFTRAAKIDPHFMVGVGNYAHALDLNNKSPEALAITDKTLTWIFGTKDWSRKIETKKRDALTPDVLDRLRTNGGIPDVKALGWFISCNSASLARLNRLPEARKICKEALVMAPRDARINFAYAQLIEDLDRKEAIHYMELAIKVAPKYAAAAIALSHERVKDKRYSEALKVLEPVLKDVTWNSNVLLDIAEAKAGLHDFKGALQALDEAQHALFVPKKELIQEKKLKILGLEKQFETKPK